MHIATRILSALPALFLSVVATAELSRSGSGLNVDDSVSGLAWRSEAGQLEVGLAPYTHEPVGDYNDVLSRYGAGSPYRFPTPAEVDDLVAQMFPGFVANYRDGRCAQKSNNGPEPYPEFSAQLDAFTQLFGTSEFESIYENAAGELRALWVRRTSGSSGDICPTGWAASYEKYRNDPPYPSELKGVLVVRDQADLQVPGLTLYDFVAPADVGLTAETLVWGMVVVPTTSPYNDCLSAASSSDDRSWQSRYIPAWACGPEEHWGEFRLASYTPDWYQKGPAPWVKVNSLEYTGDDCGSDVDLGNGWCRKIIAGAEYQFTGSYVTFPGTYVTTPGVTIDNIEIEQIRENISVDFDPWSNADLVSPHNTGWSIYIEVETTSVAAGDAADFNAADVDPATVVAGRGLAAPLEYAATDIDGDGDTDLTFKFRTGSTGVTCLDKSIVLAGRTYAGDPIAGYAAATVVNCEEPVNIDVDPFNSTNTIRPEDDYNVAVAVLGMRVANGDPIDLYPEQAANLANPNLSKDGLDTASLRFGPGAAEAVSAPVITDINGDSLDDAVVNFYVPDAAIACEDTAVVVTGNKHSGLPLEGFDAIVTEDCSTNSCHP